MKNNCLHIKPGVVYNKYKQNKTTEITMDKLVKAHAEHVEYIKARKVLMAKLYANK